jgi:penicillin-binding protein 1A
MVRHGAAAALASVFPVPEMSNQSLHHDEAGSGPAASFDPSPRMKEAGTLAAGQAFIRAFRADLAALMRRLGAALSAAGTRRTQASRGATQPAGGAWRRALGRVAKLVAGVMTVVVLGLLTLAGATLWAVSDLPAERPIGGGKTSSLLLEASNGEALGRVGQLRMPDAVRTDFPDDLVNAVIGIEDRRFYSHWGFDPAGIIRALRRNIAAGTIVEGGSTITQQFVKMRILGHERTLPRKLREALAAMWLDIHLGKDEILTRYLNSVYLGNGAYGMSAAARLYFDKRLSELTLPEAAMLAGLIQSPSRVNPLQSLDEARARAAVVIDAMLDKGVIDADTARNAKARPAAPHLSGQALRAGTWFADWVAREATAVTGSFSGNMRLRTTLIPGLQKLAEQAVAETLAGPGAERRASQAALVAMRPDGAVVAMVGGRDYHASQFNRAVDAQRQPGSAFKLFVYLAALRKGLTPADTVDGGPLDIKGWEPENYSDRHYGRVTLAEAFAESINTAAARLAEQVGLNDVIAAARDLGITGELPKVPSLALGAADVTLLDLTAAYAAARAGRAPIKPWGIAGFGVEGQPRLQSMGAPIASMQSLQPYQKPLLELLQGVIEHGTGRAAKLDSFAAGKTGTSQDYRDAWFIGFNDTLIVGVWVGNDDRTPMDRVTGGSLPAAIWKRFMTEGATVAARDSRPAMGDSRPAAAGDAPRAAAGDAQPAAEASADIGGRPMAPASADQASADRAPGAAQCDYQACARTYQSFRASDCTYQPYGGSSRRLCEKNAPERTADAPAAPNSNPRSWSERPARAQCDIDACASTYSSFDPADCTYQPYGGGPRRLCDR